MGKVVISVTIRVPVEGALLNSTEPETLNVLVAELHVLGVAVKAETVQSDTRLQFVDPAPGWPQFDCWKETWVMALTKFDKTSM